MGKPCHDRFEGHMAGSYCILIDKAALCQFPLLAPIQIVSFVVTLHHVQIQIGRGYRDIPGVRGIEGGACVGLEQPAYIGDVMDQPEGADTKLPLGLMGKYGGLVGL